MGKLGWLQDLTRGVMKLCGKDEASKAAQPAPVIQQVVQGGNPTVDSLLQRAQLFLEDEDWQSADSYADRVLDIEPTNAQAYLVKLLSELKVKNAEALADQPERFDTNPNYKKLTRFAEAALKADAERWIQTIQERKDAAQALKDAAEALKDAAEALNKKRKQARQQADERLRKLEDEKRARSKQKKKRRLILHASIRHAENCSRCRIRSKTIHAPLMRKRRNWQN